MKISRFSERLRFLLDSSIRLYIEVPLWAFGELLELGAGFATLPPMQTFVSGIDLMYDSLEVAIFCIYDPIPISHGMNQFATRASLLLRLKDHQNNAAWAEFLTIYMPLLHAYAMKAGLQDSDAADVASETIRQVFRNIDRFDYEPARGSFRGWLLTIAQNLIRKQANRSARGTPATGDSNVLELLHQQASQETTDQFETEYRMRLFQVASERVKQDFRENTWQAFWRSVVNVEDIASLSKELGMSAGAIYIARSRITARIRDEVARLEADEHNLRAF